MDKLLRQFLHDQPATAKTNPKKMWQLRRDHFANRSWFQEKRNWYVLNVAPGQYRIYFEDAFIRELKFRGLHYDTSQVEKLSAKTKAHLPNKDKPSPEKLFKVQIAEILSIIRETHAIDFIGELSGYQPGYYEDINGYRLLITRAPQIVLPRKGEYWFYENTVRTMFQPPQYHIIKTWIKYAEEIREAGPPFAPLQALIIAGGVEHGKTLFAQEILGGLLGGHADATLYFTHDAHSRFNDELAKAGISLIDDQNFPVRWSLHAFTDKLRKHTATTFRRVETKYGATINVPLFQATVLLSNTESHNFDWFPELTADISDKLLMIQSSKAELPTGRGHRRKIQRFLDAQRAAWRYHLKFEYEPPAEILSENRYGIKPFHHPDLETGNFGARQFEGFISVMDLFTSTECEGQEFIGGSFEVEMALANSPNRGIAKWAERNIKSSVVLGKWLTKAARIIPDQVFILGSPDCRASCRYRYLSPKKANAVKKAADAPEAEANIIKAKIARESATGAV
jgi:hypothetical protein